MRAGEAAVLAPLALLAACGGSTPGTGEAGLVVRVVHDAPIEVDRYGVALFDGERAVPVSPDMYPAGDAGARLDGGSIGLRLAGAPDGAVVLVVVEGLWRGAVAAAGEAEAMVRRGAWVEVEVHLGGAPLDAGADGPRDGGADGPPDAAADGPVDAGDWCGNGECGAAETCVSCPADCGACPTCPNGVCGGGEDCASCPADCGACPTCPNGVCGGGEDCVSCPADCGACPPSCGNGVCGGSEDCISCPDDCGACCGVGSPSCCTEWNPCDWSDDGFCDCGGGCDWDWEDCGVCGDGVCGIFEDCASCPEDCPGVTCPPDCGECTPFGPCSICEICNACGGCDIELVCT